MLFYVFLNTDMLPTDLVPKSTRGSINFVNFYFDSRHYSDLRFKVLRPGCLASFFDILSFQSTAAIHLGIKILLVCTKKQVQNQNKASSYNLSLLECDATAERRFPNIWKDHAFIFRVKQFKKNSFTLSTQKTGNFVLNTFTEDSNPAVSVV